MEIDNAFLELSDRDPIKRIFPLLQQFVAVLLYGVAEESNVDDARYFLLINKGKDFDYMPLSTVTHCTNTHGGRVIKVETSGAGYLSPSMKKVIQQSGDGWQRLRRLFLSPATSRRKCYQEMLGHSLCGCTSGRCKGNCKCTCATMHSSLYSFLLIYDASSLVFADSSMLFLQFLLSIS